MSSLISIFEPVSEGPSIFADDYADRWDIVASDVIDTLITRNGVWRAYEDFLLWLQDQGHPIILLSSDPFGAKQRMTEEGCHPRLLALEIEKKDLFFLQSAEKHANVAVGIDDTTTILFSQHVAHIINPISQKFRQYIEEKKYLEPSAMIAPAQRLERHFA